MNKHDPISRSMSNRRRKPLSARPFHPPYVSLACRILKCNIALHRHNACCYLCTSASLSAFRRLRTALLEAIVEGRYNYKARIATLVLVFATGRDLLTDSRRILASCEQQDDGDDVHESNDENESDQSAIIRTHDTNSAPRTQRVWQFRSFRIYAHWGLLLL